MNKSMQHYDALIARYIDRILASSSQAAPVWNVEQLRMGKKPAWNYIDGCMLAALIALYGTSGNARLIDFAEWYADYYVREDGSILGYNEDDYNIDNISGGRVLFDLAEYSGKAKYRRAISTIAAQLTAQPRTLEGSFWHKKIYPQQVWLDGLYMGQVFAARLQAQSASPDYSDIARQFGNVRRNMFDEDKRLYYHGYDCSKKAFWANPQTGLSSSFWLRSIGWFIAALADTAEIVTDTATSDYLKGLLEEALEGLLAYRDKESGMFCQVVDRAGSEGNYPETSGSLLAAYALMKAARLGAVSPEAGDIGEDILRCTCDRYLTEKQDGLHLGGICLVAGLGPENNRRRDGSYQYYISEPVVEDDAKGLAPLLTAYAECKRR